MGTKLNKNWQPQLLRGEKLRSWAHATAETTTATKLMAARTAESVIERVHELHDGAQEAMGASPQRANRACHEGCPGCCHSMISATPPEVFAIVAWLRDQMSAAEIDAIRQRAEELADKSKTMSNTKYAESMLWCPLLDDHLSCEVYPTRPLGCRAWNSLSLEACHDCYFVNHPCNKIPLDDHAYEVGQGVRSGLSRGIEAAGLDGNSYELNSALVVALDNSDAVERWACGEEVFEHCHEA